MILAHGGTAGAVAEVSFVLIPVGLFWMLSRWAKRRAANESSEPTAPTAHTETEPKA